MADENMATKGIKVPNLDEPDVEEKKPVEKKPIEKKPFEQRALKDAPQPKKQDAQGLASLKEQVLASLKKKGTGEKQGILSTGKIPIEKPAVKKELVIRKGKNRIATGIDGLDDEMGGGFEPGSVNIIGGGPGSGKSIFCMQFLVNGITKYNEAGIYITFEESSAKLKKHFSEFSWNLDALEEEGKLTIIEYTPEQVNKLLEEGGGVIDAILEKSKAKRIVVDSLTAFTMLFRDELSRIQASLKLFKLIDHWECTALLTAEADPDPGSHKSTMMEFEVDGVILLYNIRKEDIRERALEILKLRGIHHSTKIFPMKIEDKGMVIFPEEELF